MADDLNLGLGSEQLEIALKRHDQSGTVERVISMEAESALPKGENYLSTIYRITLRVVLGNGRTAKRSLILKVVPQEKAKIELVKSMGVFKSETMMYTTVLREMEALMEEFGDTSDVLWCRLVHYEPYSSLLLEDLKASGFKMTRRQDCLDLEHSLLVLRSLGRFHAMSKILEQRGIISRDDYKPYAMVSDKNLIKYFMYYGLQTLAKAMEEHWGPEWYDVAQKLKVPCEVLQEKMMKLGEIDESRFNCLNHGDCWSNNMMFKYDWQNRPYTMKFVDFQICHYNSPAFDLLYAMYSTFEPELRRQNHSALISAYHDSLLSSLRKFGFTGETPSLSDIQSEIDRLSYLRLPMLYIHGVITSQADNTLDMEKALLSQGLEGHRSEPYLKKIFQERVGPELQDLIQINITQEHIVFGTVFTSEAQFYTAMQDAKPRISTWIMFCYSDRFVDWQVGHYNSPAFDIYYAIYCSVETTVRREHLDTLFNAYLGAFEQTSQRYDWQPELTGQPRPTLEFLKSEMDRLIPLHMFSLIMIHAVVTHESGEVFDMDTALRTKGKQGINPDMYNLKYRERAGYECRVVAEKMYQQWDYGKN